MNPIYRLVLKTGPNSGQTFPLETGDTIIGRDAAATFVVNDPEVSRRHARISMQGANYIIEDLGSTNGTMVSGQRLAGPYILRPGEIITLGEHTRVLFEMVDPDATVASLRPMDVPAQPAAQPAFSQAADMNVQPVAQSPLTPPPQSFAGQVPSQPRSMAARPKKKKMSTLVVILIIIVAVLACGCIAFAIFDALNLYCQVPGVMNFLIPGACPP